MDERHGLQQAFGPLEIGDLEVLGIHVLPSAAVFTGREISEIPISEPRDDEAVRKAVYRRAALHLMNCWLEMGAQLERHGCFKAVFTYVGELPSDEEGK